MRGWRVAFQRWGSRLANGAKARRSGLASGNRNMLIEHRFTENRPILTPGLTSSFTPGFTSSRGLNEGHI